MDEARLAAILKRLVCPRCRKRYEEADLLFIAGSGKTRELNLRCLRCRLRIRLTVPQQKPRRPATRGVERQRRVPVDKPKPISEADVLEMQQFLASFQGNLEQLLKSPG